MIVLASKATIMMLVVVIAIGIIIVAVAAASFGMRPVRRYDRYYEDYVPNNRRTGETKKRTTNKR